MSKISVVKRVGIWEIKQSSGGGKKWTTAFTASAKVNGKIATFSLKTFRDVTEASKWLQALDKTIMTESVNAWAQTAARQYTPRTQWVKKEDGTSKKVYDYETPAKEQEQWVISVLKADKAGFQKPVLKK